MKRHIHDYWDGGKSKWDIYTSLCKIEKDIYIFTSFSNNNILKNQIIYNAHVYINTIYDIIDESKMNKIFDERINALRNRLKQLYNTKIDNIITKNSFFKNNLIFNIYEMPSEQIENNNTEFECNI